MVSKNIKLIIFDIDGTLLPQQSQFLLLKYLKKKKIIGIFYFIHLYSWFFLYKMGIAKDPTRVFHVAVKFLSGKSISEVKMVMDEFVTEEMSKYFFSDMLKTLREHKNKNERIILLSNAMDILVSAVAGYLNIVDHIGTELEVNSKGVFTGRIVGRLTYGEEKISKLHKYLKREKGNLANTTCYTDHHSDIPLLKIVSNPIVVNPTPNLKASALVHNWEIINPE